MTAHVTAGNRAEALRTYHQLRRMLAQELGIDPAPETQAAYVDLLGSPVAAAGRTLRPSSSRSAAPLVGRRSELATLAEAWSHAENGTSHMVLLTGEPGVGSLLLVADTAGNVYLLLELLRWHGAQRHDGDQPDARHTRRGTPSGIDEYANVRLAALEPAPRQLLRTAAAAGPSFELDVTAEAVELHPDRSMDSLEVLVANGMVAEIVTATKGRQHVHEYRFTHDVLRRAIYEQFSQARLRVLHTRLADAIERRRAGDLNRYSRIMAQHRAAGAEPGGDQRAVRWGWRAAAHATQHGAAEEAVRLHRQALEHVPAADHELRAEALTKLGLAQLAAGHAECEQIILDGAILGLHNVGNGDGDQFGDALLVDHAVAVAVTQGRFADAVATTRLAGVGHAGHGIAPVPGSLAARQLLIAGWLRQSSWPHMVGLLALGGVELGDPTTAEAVRTLLTPYADLICGVGYRSFVGPVSFHLGRLAVITGDWDEAERHLTSAFSQLASRQAWPWLALAQLALARALQARARTGDRRSVDAFRAEANGTLAGLGLQHCSKEAL